MFKSWRKKKTDQAAAPASHPTPTSSFKQSLLSLEQRLMFDAAAAATAAEVKSEQVAQDQAEAAVSSEPSADGSSTEQADSHELLQAIASYTPGESTTEVVFVDPTVPDYQSLIAGMAPNVEMVMLDATRDGMEQIAESLAGRTGIDAIHLITHGDEGRLNLGTGTLTRESMTGNYVEELATIRQSLSETADILVYGCRFAEGEVGQETASLLGELTGADVAASTDATGYAGFGGDWVLETHTGAIETTLAVSEDVQANWKGLLAETWMNASTGAVIAGPAGNDWYVGDSANNTPTAAGGGADTMYGAGGDDSLQGGSGNDILVGGTGNDTIYGNSDDDVILGGTGNDYLDGGSAVGKNTIIGGGGNDQMVGGSGADVFRFTGAQSGDAYTVDGGGATDIIDLSEFSTATITNSGGVITVDRGGGNVFTINHSNVETVITAATVGNHGPLAEAGSDQTVAMSATVTLTAAGSSDQDGNSLTYQWTQIEGPKVTLSSSTAASPTFTAPSSATTLQFVVVVSDGTTSHADTVTINVEATNVAPTISNLSGDSLSYTEGAGAVVIDQGANALVADTDSANFDTGALTVSIPVGNEPTEDVLSIRNQGTGAGQIGVSGSNVTYGGVVIGTHTGGAGGNNLVVTFNNNATPTAVTALVKNITYEDINVDAPIVGALTVRFSLTDGDGGTSANYDMTVTVSGVNDAPVLADTALSITVAEDAGGPSGAVGSLISAFTGGITDVDSGASKGIAITGSNETNGTWYYTTNGGTTWTAVGTVSNTSALLLADNASTRLYFAPSADYNGTSTAALTVRAWDQTSGTAGTKVTTASNGGTTAFSSATDTIDVSVTAVNDAPVVDLNAGSAGQDVTAAFTEQTPVLIAPVGTLTDVDSATLSSLTVTLMARPDGNAVESLSLNSAATAAASGAGLTVTYTASTGVLSITGPASTATYQTILQGIQYNDTSDSPTTSNRSITVVANDGATASTTQTVTVTVTAVNDTPTDLALSGNSVAENSANGTVVGTVSGTDPDSGDTKAYSFTDSAGGRFAINSSTGQITVANSSLLNYESATSHSVTVRVTDSGGLTYDETFTINLTNVNETPTDLSLSANTVAENAANGTVVGTVSGTDPDSGDTKNYSLTDTAGGRFAINSSTGQITVANSSLLNYESATSHSVTVRVTDSGGLTYDETFTINLTNVNEGPTGADATITITEDTSQTLTAANFGFTDVDAGDSLSAVRIDTLPGSGTLTLSGVAVTAGQVVTVTDINAGDVVFTPAADANGTGYATLTFSVRDSNSAYDTAPNSLTFDVTAINDAPIRTAGTVSNLTVSEDAGLASLGLGGVTYSSGGGGDESGQALTYAVTAIPSASVGDVFLADGTTRVTVGSYTLADIQGMQFKPAANATGVTAFQFNVYDSGGTANGGADNISQFILITVNAVNDAPTITNLSGDSLSYSEGDGAVVIEQGANALVADVDSANLDTGTLTVSIPSGGDSAEDVLSIRNQGTGAGQIGVSGSTITYGGTTIGIFTGGSSGSNLVITLNSNATLTAVTALVQNITYENTDTNAPTTGARTVRYVLTDGDGGTSANYDTTVTVSGTNDAPVLTPVAPDVTFVEGGLPQVFDATGTIVDVDSANFDGGTLTVSISANGTVDDRLVVGNWGTGPGQVGLTGSTVTYEGTAIGTVSGGTTGSDPLVITFNPSATPTAVQEVYRSIQFNNVSDNPSTTTRTLTIGLTDGDGGTATPQTKLVYVQATNDAPTDLSLSANTVAENAANGTVVGTVTGTDVDVGDTKSYSLTDTAGGRFAINSSTGQITVANGSLLNYESATSHTVTVRVTDSGGLTYDEAFTINLTNVNEVPTGADATVTISEDTSHTLTTANFGFSDVDAGDSFSAVRIDSLPTAGSLTLSGVAVTAGQVVSVANITAGNLVFIPAADANGTGYASVTFSVRDGAGSYDAAPNTLTVNVSAVNDAPVLVTNDGCTLSAGETIALSAKSLNVVDVDNGAGQLQYRITSLPTNGTILLKGAQLSVKDTFTQADIDSGILEYQHNGSETASDSFAFVVDDGAGGSLAESTFKIAVTPVNDAPVLSTNEGGTVNEGGAIVLTGKNLEVTDADTPPNELRYTLMSLPTNGALLLKGTPLGLKDSFTQEDINNGILEYVHDGGETTSDSLTFMVEDGAGGLIKESSFEITVNPVNEAPTDLSLSASTVAENAANGTVVGTVTGTDVDVGDTKSYSLTDTAGGRFAINSSTGQITVANGSLLNYETATSHSVTVRVTDSGGLTYDEAFTINLTNVNETPAAINMSAITVAENAPDGTVVGTASTTDPDAGDTHTYQLTDTAGGRFAINASTGVITVADGSLLNYEAATSHSITVRTTDAGGLTHDQVLAIAVTDVNEATMTATTVVPGPLLPGTPAPPTTTIPPTTGGPVTPGPTDGGVPTPGPAPTPTVLPPDAARSVSPAVAPRVIPVSVSPVGLGHVQEGEKPMALEDDREPIAWTVVEPVLNLLHEAADQLRTLAQSPEIPARLSEFIVKELDAMTESLEQAMEGRQDEETLVAATAAGVSIVLSTGYVVWALRGGWLLASLLATMPAWRSFDPLPVLVRAKEDRDQHKDKHDDRRAARREDERIEHLFGSEDGRAA